MVDDVWTVATLDAIKSKLPDHNNGNRIIVTTRIETVAKACSDAEDCIYRINPLNPEDSKKLFLSRVLGSKDSPCPSGLEEEMGKILKKCGGLPMAIISIAGLLASYKSPESKDMWERVRRSIGSQMESHPTLEGMKQIITLSYNHLHYYLKGCLMYLSIFPEDFIIVKNRLLKRWIAEGLVGEIRGLTLMEVAEAYYNELVSRGMIDRVGDVVTHHYGRLEMCRVHDMILEVMVSKSLEANFVSLVGGPYQGMSYGTIRRLSIHGGEQVASTDSPKTVPAHGRKNDIEGMKMEHVRSLSMFDLEDQTKVLDRLGEFSLLRVLDLEDCMSMEDRHLKHVCRMHLLRFLSMKGTEISKMPEEVRDLENLETLDVRETKLEDLPATVSNLEKLEQLQISNKENLYTECWIAPKDMGRMKALRMVNAVTFGTDKDAAEELGKLQELRELRIIMNSDPTEPKHQGVMEMLAKSLSKLYSLRWLNIIESPAVRGYHPDEEFLNFLHRIEPPPRLLQYLSIGSGISELPSWIKLLNDLVELSIAWTYFEKDQLFGPICKLPRLKYLRLDAYYYKDPELVAQTAHTFPALKYLYLNYDIEHMEVLQFEEKTMPELETLHVRFLDRDSKRIVGVEHLASLKEVQLEGRKGNTGLQRAVEQLKTLNEECTAESGQVKVAVKYE